MNWTLEQRYQRIDDMPAGYFENLIKQREQDKHYPSFHIAPPYGLLNDPNGLSEFNGEHHIFYQWFPIGPTHGLKHWYHVSTKDFVNYTDHGVALYPDQDYDSHGVYSGGGLVEGEDLLLFFTGNKRDQDWVREPTQCYATMNKQGEITKQGVVVRNSDYTEHFRDPKVWKEGDTFYMVVAAQTQELHGSMVLYRAKELGEWEHLGPIHTRYNQFGFMWECPDYFELDGKGIMLFSPQGVNSDNVYDYKNIFSVSYILGDTLNKEKVELDNHQDIAQPDYGFDFYAPQTYLDEKGRRIMFAWIGLPEIDTPSVKHQWTGLLSLPRELRVKEGYLIQKPLKELEALRQSEQEISGLVQLASTTFELNLSCEGNFSLELSNDAGDNMNLILDDDKFTLDRSNNTETYAEEYGLVRYAPRIDKQQNVRMFVDNSVLEIFINNGKQTMTSRFFIEDMSILKLSEGVSATLHYMSAIQATR
ncbi:sucrose-6-phosphate hydrolase [Vibrio crassostreae]|uniref:sucrose-6-phosphate hydrolase n=1 Tax=Vibrio crassostreae TaxID=246167 RepID=UPI001053020F|nr:sucrose-6-phosphate hydrolase [Vibrio crassostreae]TCN91566.1 beta-fructofuranosidase [Vibrio crassostreae]CAK2060635.1 Sucrose-6-phosphate hydrolase [Vibrio crassostreae]CAK2816165.1 Sucrose-6-phosphate hydrolase [Vibrio crassostreae]CAK2880339.1 Sucrose-6-phosphate hydrolase [Vibrio crassostreae]CAK2928731.1 Sucrose-6-phosphate hydrolase [Vibrio crassostreae]